MGGAQEPTAAIIDAQSTRSTAQGGETGFDAGKKRKRHPVVDTLGLLLAVTITAASVQDRDAAAPVVAQACAKVPGLKKLYADGAYGGKCALAIEQAHKLSVEIVRHPGNRGTGTWTGPQQVLWPEEIPRGFVVLPKRWVVERTHAWNERARRLMAHHDRSNWAAIAWVWLAESRTPRISLGHNFPCNHTMRIGAASGLLFGLLFQQFDQIVGQPKPGASQLFQPRDQ